MSRTPHYLAGSALVAAPTVTAAALAVDLTPQAGSTEELLALAAEHGQRWSLTMLLFLLAGVLWVPAGLALLRLFGRCRPIGWCGAVAVLLGGAASVPMDAAGLYLPSLATSAAPLDQQVAVVEGVESSPAVVVFEIVHAVGLFAGLLVVAAVLLWTRIVPRWIPAGIAAALITVAAAPHQLVQAGAMAAPAALLAVLTARVLRSGDGEWRHGAPTERPRVPSDA